MKGCESCDASHHEADHGELDESEMGAGEVLKDLGEPTIAPEPAESPLYDPALGEHNESLGRVGAFDDLERQAGRLLDRSSGRGTLIAAVANGARQEWEEAAHPFRSGAI